MLEEKVNFKLTYPIQVGILVPLTAIKNGVLKYCFKYNLKCEILQSGFLCRDVTFLIKGNDTLKNAHKYDDDFKAYFHRLSIIYD
jgi:hypothetical protein